MRFPRVRFRLRTLLVLVAVTGAGAGGAALAWREAAAVAASLPPEHRPLVWESVRGLGIGLGGLIAFVAVVIVMARRVARGCRATGPWPRFHLGSLVAVVMTLGVLLALGAEARKAPDPDLAFFRSALRATGLFVLAMVVYLALQRAIRQRRRESPPSPSREPPSVSARPSS